MPLRLTLSLIAGLVGAIALAPAAVHAVVPTPAPAAIDQEGQVARVRDFVGDGRISAGDAVYFEYRVSATGAGVRNVVVVAPLLGAVICARTGLAAGESMTCASHAAYVVNDADVAAGHFDVAAHAEGTDDAGVVVDSATGVVRTRTGTPTDSTGSSQ